MNNLTDLDRARRAAALLDWLAKCREDMGQEHRFPKIDFESDTWAIRSKYKTKLGDIKFAPIVNAFASLDDTYSKAIRCIAAETALSDEVKSIDPEFRAWRRLARVEVPSLLDLRRTHLQKLENILVKECRSNPSSAGTCLGALERIGRLVDRLSRVGVIEPASWNPAHDTVKALKDLDGQHRRRVKEHIASTLDRQIEALSDAMRALFIGDERLSAYDRAALATMGVLMCAPSRVNEPLCMAVDDVIVIEDYAKRREGQEGSAELERAHMLLLQKGSKGADWGAKPALNFMVDLLKLCMKIIEVGGKRSRMLAQWYEQCPDKLYLPPALEGYRGQMVTRSALWQITNLSEREPTKSETTSMDGLWRELRAAGIICTISNPKSRSVASRTTRPTVQAFAWDDIELVLLRHVNEALAAVRRVTSSNHYDGRISNMLMLFDADNAPYLPGSIKYGSFARRFKQTQAHRKAYLARTRKQNAPTVFEKLDLRMVVDGRVEYAWIAPHDPRRWLTTQAMLARERLSDVLINKWANRLSIDQLKHYDLRSETQRADQAAMPAIKELADISAGLLRIEGIEAEYGLKTDIVTAHEAGVSVTSMEAIASATKDRPVARTSGQIIILYPSRFGMCLHQHHETPCRAYASCMPCSEDLVVKGHLPTNEEVRKRHELLSRSIISQLERLVTAHNREIADSPDGLEGHMLSLVRKGLTAEEMSDELIAEFQEIKDRIKSPSLRNELEEAFVARGMVQRLDDPKVSSGALIRYHNPSRHASPGHERALDAHGGRAAIDARLERFHREHSQFAPTSLGLKDQRELLEQNEEDDDE